MDNVQLHHQISQIPSDFGKIPAESSEFYRSVRSMYEYNLQVSSSIARRNARERSRVKQVNDGFESLRQCIPQSMLGSSSAQKKLSKVDTLKVAVSYIKHLKDLLAEDSNQAVTPSYMYSNASNDSYSSHSSSFSHDEGFGSSRSSEENFYHYNCPLSTESTNEEDILDYISQWQQN